MFHLNSRTRLAALFTTALVVALLIPASAEASRSAIPGARYIALGVNVSGDDDYADLNSYTEAAGRAPSVLMWYQNWGEPLYWSSQMQRNDAVGATPMITWDPATSSGGIPLRDIVNGQYDQYLDASAQLARSYGKPLLIRFAHEMNLSGSLWGPGHDGNTPAEFVAAWRHVVSRFAADGATNVQWVWSPNVDCGGRCPFDAYFPGDAYVSYLALDGYNYSSIDNVPWLSFRQIFAPSYADITALSPKPVIIAETASASVGGDKAAWIQQAFLNELPVQFPRVVAAIWFDRVKETDWRVNSSASSLQAWQNVVSSPIFSANFTTAVATTPVTTTDPPRSQPTTTPKVPTSLRLKRIRYMSAARDHNRNARLNAQYVVVRNVGRRPVPAKGWTITNRLGHRFHFPERVVRPGATVTVRLGHGRNRAHTVYWRRRSSVWRAHSDRVRLADRQGTVIDTCSWHPRRVGIASCH